MIKTYVVIGAIILTASAAWAHQGVKNKAVKARMDAMSAIAANTKTLGEMAKGATDFEAGKARAAAAAIAEHAAATPALFEANEDDPKSEAKPEIWTSFEDFSAKARDLEILALGLSTSISAPGDLGPAMRDLGASCKACHGTYRE